MDGPVGGDGVFVTGHVHDQNLVQIGGGVGSLIVQLFVIHPLMDGVVAGLGAGGGGGIGTGGNGVAGTRAGDVGRNATRDLGLGMEVCTGPEWTSGRIAKAHGPRESNTILQRADEGTHLRGQPDRRRGRAMTTHPAAGTACSKT